jgi:acetyl esterase
MSAAETAAVMLEPAAQDFADATPNPPYLFDLGPQTGRETVDEVQSAEIDRPEVEIEDRTVPGGPGSDVSVRIMRPQRTTGALPVIVYTHDAGWVFGNAHTHDRLIRELTHGTGAALVFPNCSLSPEAHYPTAIEEIYAVLAWIANDGHAHGLDSSRIAVSGDSVGGNMTATITLMAKQRSGPELAAQVLSTPSPTRALTPTPITSSPRVTCCAATPCSGSGTSTRPTSANEQTSSPRRCAPPQNNSADSRGAW